MKCELRDLPDLKKIFAWAGFISLFLFVVVLGISTVFGLLFTITAMFHPELTFLMVITDWFAAPAFVLFLMHFALTVHYALCKNSKGIGLIYDKLLTIMNRFIERT